MPDLHENTILFRGRGYRLQIHDKNLAFERDVVFDRGKGYFKVVNGNESTGWSVLIQSAGLRITVTTDSDDALIPSADIAYPLVVRSRRDGDAIKTGTITKDLKKLYNEWNVRENDRWKVAVCEDRSGIIAIIGKPFGYPNLRRSAATPSGISYAFERF